MVTSKEAILQVCRSTAAEKGVSALNMRSVAAQCHVALGSLYNYFPSKDALVLATVESIWQEIFQMEGGCPVPSSFADAVLWLFTRVQNSAMQYPDFFAAHADSFPASERCRAREVMQQSLAHIKLGLSQSLQADGAVAAGVFHEGFTPSDWIDFVLSNVLSLLAQQKQDCGVLLDVIGRVLYSPS